MEGHHLEKKVTKLLKLAKEPDFLYLTKWSKIFT